MDQDQYLRSLELWCNKMDLMQSTSGRIGKGCLVLSYYLSDLGSMILIYRSSQRNTPKTQRVLVKHTFVFVYIHGFGLTKSVQFMLKS